MRVLLLMSTRTYRAHAFLEAARRLGVEVVVGSDQPQALSEFVPGSALTLNFLTPKEATAAIVAFANRYPLTAVVGVDDDTTVLAAMAAAALSLPHNSVESAQATRNKHDLRQHLARAHLPSPSFQLLSIDDDPVALAPAASFPCVVKPLFLSASRGVIRADDAEQFVLAFHKLAAILRQPDVAATGGEAARQILVETFIPGQEVALEGLLTSGQAQSAGDLRQARSPRWTLLRGDDLCHAFTFDRYHTRRYRGLR